MQDLINSIVRFSAAMTLFSLQQIQNAVDAASDPDAAEKKFRKAIDSVTDAISGQLDENKKPALDSMSKLGTDIVDRTWETLDDVPAMDPKKVLDTTSDIIKKTSDSLAEFVKKADTVAPESGEPQLVVSG